MDEKIVEAVYPAGKKIVPQEDFIDKFTKPKVNLFKKTKKITVEWIFSPIQVYTIFKSYIDAQIKPDLAILS